MRSNQSDYTDPGDLRDELNLDQRAIAFNETVAEDDLDEDDRNEDDLLDDDPLDEEAMISDLPQVVTESYGTGVHDAPGMPRRGGRTAERRMNRFNDASPILTGGDIDANFEQANAVGDEAVGGTVATPDQDIVDELGAAVGLEMDDRSFLRTNDILEERDDRRWELDPKSSEDYEARRE